MYLVGTSKFNEACLRRATRQGAQDSETLRRGTWRHLVAGIVAWKRCSVIEAMQTAAKVVPELAQEFDAEAGEILHGVTLAFERLGAMPDPEDVIAVEMYDQANVPAWARGQVRNEPGIVVPLTDEVGLQTGGMDWVFRRWDDRGRCALVIENWKGREADYANQAAAEAVIAWRLGWAEGCHAIVCESRGLVYPWVKRHDFSVGDMDAVTQSVIDRIESIRRADQSEDPPANPNEHCDSCSLKGLCPAVVLPVVDPDAAVYLGSSIETAPMATLMGARDLLKPRVKLAETLLEEIEKEAERRIAAGEAPGWELKRTPCRYDGKDSEAYRKKALDMGMKKELEEATVTKLDIGKLEKQMKARAALIGKTKDIENFIKDSRGEATAFRKEIRRVDAPAQVEEGEANV